MASGKWLRMQAAKCATLIAQTTDEDTLRRYQRLEQNYLQLAEAEERQAGQKLTRGTGQTSAA